MAFAAIAAFRAGLAEVLLLREAERTVIDYGEERLEAIRADKKQATAELRASRRFASPQAALVVLDAALPVALRALRRASNTDAFAERVAAVEAARAGRDSLDFAGAETERDRLDALVADVLAAVEARSPLELRALRLGRMLAIAVAVVAVGWPFVRHHWLVHDVALHKPVMTSPLKYSPPTGAELVDGHRRGTYGVHTNDGHPFVIVDLERTYLVREVKVFNRGDGWFDDVLPLTLSVSEDGIKYDDVARRTDHFDVWDVQLDRRATRYVRLSNNSYIALNAIEVYARE